MKFLTLALLPMAMAAASILKRSDAASDFSFEVDAPHALEVIHDLISSGKYLYQNCISLLY